MTREQQICDLACVVVDLIRSYDLDPEVQTAALVTALAVMIEANWRWENRVPTVDHYLAQLRERVVCPQAKRHPADTVQ